MIHQSESCGLVARLAGRLILLLWRWRVEGELPPDRKFIILGAPHTSNWDFLVMVATVWSWGLRVRFLGKAELFRGPKGWLLRRLGGIPVDRSAARGLVEQLAGTFERTDRIALLIPPEGTRGRRAIWKSGFYHLALAVHVPVVAGFADYARRRAGVKGVVHLSGDVVADMDQFRRLYAGVVAKHPHRGSAVRLAGEDGAGSSAGGPDRARPELRAPGN